MDPLPFDEYEIFSVAADISDQEAREQYLSQACGENAPLRQRMRELLIVSDRKTRFLQTRSSKLGYSATVPPPVIKRGMRVGNYRILKEIGKGGFGVVYLAEQAQSFRRRVALKIIKPGMDTQDVLTRFEAERQALSIMDHPNIARLFDGGQTPSGHPYFVMELVEGVAITKYADDNRLSPQERLRLFAQVCEAVQHAHQKGIIHRDLKPSNVLVTTCNGLPVPKVIDFGVAKALSRPLTAGTLCTRRGEVIGTPQYMSPEQAESSGLDVDTRSDVYSLGVLMYELLVGRVPIERQRLQAAGIAQLRRVICEQEPRIPSQLLRTLDLKTASTVAASRSCERETLRRQLSGEIDWIAMRALEKDRHHRYQSAAALGSDVKRHLNNEPIDAGPVNLSYRLRKTWRRNRTACATVAVVATVLCISLGVALKGWWREVAANDRVRAAYRDAEEARGISERERAAADRQRNAAVREAANSQRTLEIVLQMLGDCGINPQTGAEYTVSDALDGLEDTLEADAQLRRDTAAHLHLGLARALLASGQRERSRLHYRRAAEIGYQLGEQASEVIGDIRRELAHVHASLEELELAVLKDREANDLVGLVKSLTLLGSVALDQGQSRLAEDVLREAVHRCPADGADLRFIEIPHLVWAQLLQSTGNLKAADAAKATGMAIARRLCWQDDQAWYRKAVSLTRSDFFAEATRAFEVAEHCSGSVDAHWMKQLGHKLRAASHFTLADRAYRSGVAIATENHYPAEHTWNLLNRGRLRFHARDHDGAESYYKEAIVAAQALPPKNANVRLWTHFEYARHLTARGREDDAQPHFAACLDVLADNPGFFPLVEEQFYRCVSRSMIEGHREIRPELVQYVDPEASERTMLQTYLLVHLYAQFPDFAIEGLDAAEEFEKFCRSIQPYEVYFVQAFEDAYVEWMVRHQRMDQAAAFLAEMVEKRDQAFDRLNPERGWTRVRLARVLIQQNRQQERASKLLAEGLTVLEANPMVPLERLEEIRTMRKAITNPTVVP